MMTERTRNEIEGDCVVLQERPKRTSAGEWIHCTLAEGLQRHKLRAYRVRIQPAKWPQIPAHNLILLPISSVGTLFLMWMSMNRLKPSIDSTMVILS